MAHFTTSGKRFPEGTIFDGFGGADLNPVPTTSTFMQTAPRVLPDDPDQRMFLFWDTGRRLTSKRSVQWHFNHPENWATWNAVAWYGTPGPGGIPNPTVTFSSIWVGTGTMDPSPVDGAGSTFTNGPGGEVAWPYTGDDHLVRTEWGPATVRALDHLQRSAADPLLNFSSLSRLVWGGEDDEVFQESDDDITTSGTGVFGVVNTTAQTLDFGQSEGSIVVAGYVRPVGTQHGPWWIDRLYDLVRDLGFMPPDKGDPSPDDIIRLKLIAESLDLVRGSTPSETDVFEGLVGAAGKMDAAELKRTIAGTQAMLRRGDAALKSMEAIAARLEG